MRKRPDPVTVGEWVNAHAKDYPGVGMADVANFYALSIASAREESILHLAAVVRREGLKQQAEGKLLGMVADCQRYGNEPSEIASGAATLATHLEDGCAVHVADHKRGASVHNKPLGQHGKYDSITDGQAAGR